MNTKSQQTRGAEVKGTAVFVETYDAFDDVESGMDPVYQAKAKILNDAFQQIGMGRYQVEFPIIAIFGRILHWSVATVYGHWLRVVLVSELYFMENATDSCLPVEIIYGS